ncbi:lipase family protein [Paenibacillus cymbidii]|uniref:lipase family protein n=1 Tax=Paenibacillus cymbidii TaxID=1639034 RepID=UPI001F227C4C|nr:lipase family protein [Paenibacillus cymbidii]
MGMRITIDPEGKARRTGVSRQQAILLAAVCGQTYNQFNNPDGSFVVPYPYRTTGTFEGASYNRTIERFGFVLESERDVIVAFRGTGSTVDWISDMIARQCKYPFVRDAGWSHTGFTDIYRSMRRAVVSLVDSCNDGTGRPVYVTGHSLGGALAALNATDLAGNRPEADIRVCTFGAPRAGNPEFAGAFNRTVADSRRYHNEFDIVPHLPPLYYKSPKTDAIYRYMHVSGGYPLKFRHGSIGANHVIASYYQAVAKFDPAYAAELNANNPGFCPQPQPEQEPGSEADPAAELIRLRLQ